MESKILLPKALCDVEAIKYVARRYETTPERVLSHYFVQTGMVASSVTSTHDSFELAPNELALLGDLGVRPSKVEII